MDSEYSQSPTEWDNEKIIVALKELKQSIVSMIGMSMCHDDDEYANEFLKLLKSAWTWISEAHNAISFGGHQNLYFSVFLKQLSRIFRLYQLIYDTAEYSSCRRDLASYLDTRLLRAVEQVSKQIEGQETFSVEAGIHMTEMERLIELLSEKGETMDMKSLIESFLCRAYSIAKVCRQDDKNGIIFSCKTILQQFENLKLEINAENSLLTPREALKCSLLVLERRLNEATLRLILRVFADHRSAPRRLSKFCFEVVEDHTRSDEDLTQLFEEFDNYSDLIYELASFSISCSTNVQQNAEIFSCLASLESMEAYLLPAMSKLYLDRTCQAKRAFVKCLVNHWIDEVSSLQVVLCNLIDCCTFSQICVEELINYETEIVECENVNRQVEVLVEAVKCAKFFQNYAIVALKDEISQNDTKITTLMENLKIYLNKCMSLQSFSKKHPKVGNSSLVNQCSKVFGPRQHELEDITNQVSKFEKIGNHSTTSTSFKLVSPVLQENKRKLNKIAKIYGCVLSTIREISDYISEDNVTSISDSTTPYSNYKLGKSTDLHNETSHNNEESSFHFDEATYDTIIKSPRPVTPLSVYLQTPRKLRNFDKSNETPQPVTPLSVYLQTPRKLRNFDKSNETPQPVTPLSVYQKTQQPETPLSVYLKTP